MVPVWVPGPVGIDYIDTTKQSTLKRLTFITCRKCDTPLRIEMVRDYDAKDATWLTIEPMVWVNPSWWYCTRCCLRPVPNCTELGGAPGFLPNQCHNKLITASKWRDTSFPAMSNYLAK